MNATKSAASPWDTLRGLTDSLAGAMLGAAVYGAWAVWANWSAGPEMAFSAGAGHWLVSTLLTYFGTRWMRGFFHLGRGPAERMSYAVLGGLSLTYLSLITVHLAIGTPMLLLTLLPGAVPNLLFCGSYARLLHRTEAVGATFPGHHA